MPQAKPARKENETASDTESDLNFDPSEIDDAIRALLDEYVRPAVENDGGAIDFLGFKDGVVSVRMKGACAGCPSSTATLKGGIETLLKQHLPEVTNVMAINN
jgi:Fe-S cluster biogenesis protein NfuA